MSVASWVTQKDIYGHCHDRRSTVTSDWLTDWLDCKLADRKRQAETPTLLRLWWRQKTGHESCQRAKEDSHIRQDCLLANAGICQHNFTHCIDMLVKFFQIDQDFTEQGSSLSMQGVKLMDHSVLYLEISPKNEFLWSVSVALCCKLWGIEMSF